MGTKNTGLDWQGMERTFPLLLFRALLAHACGTTDISGCS